MGCTPSKVTVDQQIQIESLKRQLEEKDKVIADYRDLLRDKQIQPNAADPPSYERSAGISGLTQREENLLKNKKMQGHYWGNDSASGVRPHTGKDEYCALMKAVAGGMKTFNIKCTLKSDVAIEMNGYKIRQVSKVPGLTLLLGEMIIGWELYLSKDGRPLPFKAKCDYISEPSGRSVKTQDWETSENDDGEAKVVFVTDGNGKDVRWNVTILA